MAYNEQLATRIRKVLIGNPAVTEKKMFGGLSFLLGGNMCCGVTKGDDLVLRLGPEKSEQALAKPHVRACDFTGRPMKGMVMVDPPGYKTDAMLKKWLKQAQAFASSLPTKS